MLLLLTPADKQHQEAKVPVAIKVIDVNDNAPKFAAAYEAFVCENARSNQVWLCPAPSLGTSASPQGAGSPVLSRQLESVVLNKGFLGYLEQNA